MCRLLRGVFLGLLLLLLFSTPAYAITDPSSITIESVRVFQNLWEDGDQLYIVEYKVMYDPDPDEDPPDTFLVGVWEGSTQEFSRPLDYYDHNFTSIYLTAAQALGWEGSYTVKVMGNPIYFTSLVEGTNMRSLGLTGGHWVSGAQELSRGYLQDWCVQLAETFEASWSLTLLTEQNRLNATGASKFKEAIPGLDGICPTLFQVAAGFPTYDEGTYLRTYEEELQARVGTRLQNALNNLGAWMNIPGSMIGGIGIAVLFFILAGRIFVATGSTTAAIACSIPFLFAGNLIGVLPLTITFIAGFLVIVMFGVTFIMARF